MLDIIRSAARVLMLILSGDLDPVPARDVPDDSVPVPVTAVPVVATTEIM